MKLLFDHNLSPTLVIRLRDVFPEANHVALAGLDRASDTEVWAYARAHGYTIVTKDVDFSDLSLLRGFPPRVIRLRLGNCTTAQVEALIRRYHDAILAFGSDAEAGALELLPW